jgi:hypothetical protein
MPRNDQGVSTLTIIVLFVSMALAVMVAVLVLHQHHEAAKLAVVSASRPPLTADQRAYLTSFTFSDFHMSAADNFLGNTVTYLDGTVTNQGSKPVSNLDVDLTFVDTLNQVVLRETIHPLADRTSPLGPGQSYAFRATFEHIPVDWNQAAPEAKAVFVEF